MQFRKVLDTMKITSCLSFALALTAMLGMASSLSAQSGSGSVQGKVLDPSGALIPQARITLSNADGFSHTYESNSEGTFTVSELAPGNYSVSVSATGFTSALDSVQVTEDNITREDVKLGISVDQEIEVYAW